MASGCFQLGFDFGLKAGVRYGARVPRVALLTGEAAIHSLEPIVAMMPNSLAWLLPMR
jgi:hypothetical protein